MRQTAAPVPIEIIVHPQRISTVGVWGESQQVRLGDSEEIILSQDQLDYLKWAAEAYGLRAKSKRAKKIDLILKLRDGSARVTIQCSVSGILKAEPYQMPPRSPLSAGPEDPRPGPFFKVVLDIVDVTRVEEPSVPEIKPELGEGLV